MLFEPFLAGRAAEMRQGNTTSLCSLAIFDRKVNWASGWTLLFICRILADMRIRQSVDFNLCAARWIELLASSLFYLLSSHLGAHQPLKAFRRLWLPLWMLIPYGPYCFGGFYPTQQLTYNLKSFEVERAATSPNSSRDIVMFFARDQPWPGAVCQDYCKEGVIHNRGVIHRTTMG